jgi:anti-sigma B factor antagonist
MIRLTCFSCGLTVPYEGSGADLCPRCLARSKSAVQLIRVSDRPSTGAPRTIGRLSMQTKAHEGRHVVVLGGELDIASAPMLEATLEELCAADATEVTIDMAGVEFVDSMGLKAILRGQALCSQHGCEYSLTPAQRPARRVFEVTKLIDRLPFRSTPQS